MKIVEKIENMIKLQSRSQFLALNGKIHFLRYSSCSINQSQLSMDSVYRDL